MGIFSIFRKSTPHIETRSLSQELKSVVVNTTETQVSAATADNSALSVLFGQFRLTNSPETLSAFFAARELISNSVAELPVVVKKKNEVDSESPLLDLFYRNQMSKYIMVKKAVEDMIDYGQSLFYISRTPDGTPIDLTYMPRGTWSTQYNTTTGDLFYRINGKNRLVEPVNVLHFYKNSDIYGYDGIPLGHFAKNILGISASTDNAAKNYYKSGCTYKAALTIKGARKNSKEQARRAFEEVNNGANSTGLVILDDDMSLQTLSSDADKSQMLETRLFNVTEIARFFNINPVLLGDLSKSSYSTIEAANIEFVTHTLMPYISIFECELNRKLIKPSQRRLRIDLDESYLIRGDRASTATYLNTLVQSGIMTRNEARKQLGFAPLEGLDDIIIPFTNIESNTITNNKNNEEDNEEVV